MFRTTTTSYTTGDAKEWTRRNGGAMYRALVLGGVLALVGMVAYLVNRVSEAAKQLAAIQDGARSGGILPWSVVCIYNATSGQTVHVTTSSAAPSLATAPGIDQSRGSAVRLVPVDKSRAHAGALRGGDSVYVQFVAWGLFYKADDESRLTNDISEATPVVVSYAGTAAASAADLQPTSVLQFGTPSDAEVWKDLTQGSANVRLLPFVGGCSEAAPGRLLGY